MPKFDFHKARAAVGIAVAVCALASSAVADLASQHLAPCQEIRALKLAYLRCEQAAQTGRLQTSAIAHCSLVYDELKDRAFDGDYARLRAWYQPIAKAQDLRSASASLSADLSGRPACP
jgi:hypothetical protein